MELNFDYKEAYKILNILEETSVIISEEEILQILKIRKRWPKFYPSFFNGQPSIEIINVTGSKTLSFFSEDGYLDYLKWFELYEIGYTTLISNVGDIHDDLRKLSKILLKELGFIPNFNIYFSRTGKRASFPAHTHYYDVLVKQIYGNSEWVISGEKISLCPQQTLMAPKNVFHEVVSKENDKMSLTINIDSIGQYC